MRVITRLVHRLLRVNPLAVDASVALMTTVVTLVWAHTLELASGERPVDGWGVALICLANLPLAVRRHTPVAVLAVSSVTAAVYFAARYPAVLNQIVVVLAVYTVAAHRSVRDSVAGAVVGAGVLGYGQIVLQTVSDWLAAAQGVIVAGGAWFVGNSTRRLVENNRILAVLSGQLARAQEDRAVRAVTAERVRIARELHDVVAHHMSVISVQAGVARYVLESDPATTSASLDTINDTSRRALEEMRRLLAVLRLPPERPEDDLDSYDPAPGLDRLGELLDQVRGAGVPVTLAVHGEARPLPSGQDLCAYRVIQESLTNVLKHARPAHATVTLAFHTRTFDVRITNDGRTSAEPGPEGQGQGLIGMRERARLYGGTLSAGPLPGGGFEVKLVLPLSGVC